MKSETIDVLLRQYISGDPACDLDLLRKELEKPENLGIREELMRFKKFESADLVPDAEKMWASIELHKNAGKNKSRVFRILYKYAAAIILPLLSGSLWLLVSETKKNDLIPETFFTAEITPGGNQALLILANGERVDLPICGGDSVSFRIEAVTCADAFQSMPCQSPLSEPSPEFNTLIIPRAGEYRLTLADGTVVWLNAESELRFPTNFTKKQRKVYLKGEAYFRVAENKEKPFVVEVNDMKVEVLGTEFNINAYLTEGKIFTTLVNGSIRLQNNLNDRVRILKPHQQAEFLNGQLSVKEVDVSAYVSWIHGKFYFESTPLKQIVEQLQRWYDLDFFFAEEKLEAYEFTGVIRRDHTANEIFRIIEKTTNIKFELNGRNVVVR